MRKHNQRVAMRGGKREDRTNFVSVVGHSLMNDKLFQLFANGLLRGLLKRI